MKTILAASIVLALTACSNNQSMIVDYGTDDTKDIQKIAPEEGYAALKQLLEEDFYKKLEKKTQDFIQIIQDHDNYIDGMRATSVEEKDDVLVFKGEYFLDDGLPTTNTPAAFNMFKYLAHHLSKEFSLK